MSGAYLLALMLLTAPPPVAPEATTESKAVSLDESVRIALGRSAKVKRARVKIDEYRARLAEVESIHYPKIKMMGFVAPTFGVKGSALDVDVERDYSSWGPYLHLEGILAWPIYAFGRISKGKEAARARVAVERARLREAENAVALEVRKLYYMRLFAVSILPTLDLAHKAVDAAIETAQKQYEDGSGTITQADLGRLEFARTEVLRGHRLAVDGVALATAALKHTMGLAKTAKLTFEQRRLRWAGREPTKTLAEFMTEAAKRRPEWAQIRAGKRATLALEKAEALANAPVLFLAGSLTMDWAPTREDSPNPYHYDTYNQITGGVVLGLTWDFDPALAAAKADGARAMHAGVLAIEDFARTGIPLQVRKGYQAVKQFSALMQMSRSAVKATRKWMTMSGAAYKTGTGEAKDLLEGLAAYTQAKRKYYADLRDLRIAQAELLFATGKTFPTRVGAAKTRTPRPD